MQVFTYRVGGNTRVVISGYQTIKELLVNNADYTSNRSTKSMSKVIQEYASNGMPGKLLLKMQSFYKV